MCRDRSTMQKGFIFLLVFWNSSPLAFGQPATNHLKVFLGCRAVIPCQEHGKESVKWFYKKDEHSAKIVIVSLDKRGPPLYGQRYNHRMKVLHSHSLVIDNITDDDRGLYWCETHSWNKPPSVTSVETEILKEVEKTVYVTAGSNFTHACAGDLTNLKWTFERLRDSAQGSKSSFVISNKSIQILYVGGIHAGKYTCWTSGCDKHKQKLLTINLCVVTVNHSRNSSVSCAVMCDVEFKSNVATDTRTVNVDQYRFLNCSKKQMLDEDSTQRPSNALSNATDTPTVPKNRILTYGTSAAVICLFLLALFICFFRSRLQTAFPIHLCCCGSNDRVEEETSIVYSSVVIRRPANTTNDDKTNSVCVYSEIKV